MFLVNADFEPVEIQDLVDRVRERGGSLVLFQRVFSIGAVTWREAVFEYVPPHGSRTFHVIKNSLLTLLLGPWSVYGPVLVVDALITNLSGGLASREYVPGEAGLVENLSMETEYLQVEKDRRTAVFVPATLFIIALVLAWFAYTTYF